MDSLYDFSLHVTLLLGQLFNGGSCIIELCGQTSYRCVAPHDSSSEVSERRYMMHLQILHSIVGSHGNIVPSANTFL